MSADRTPQELLQELCLQRLDGEIDDQNWALLLKAHPETLAAALRDQSRLAQALRTLPRPAPDPILAQTILTRIPWNTPRPKPVVTPARRWHLALWVSAAGLAACMVLALHLEQTITASSADVVTLKSFGNPALPHHQAADVLEANRESKQPLIAAAPRRMDSEPSQPMAAPATGDGPAAPDRGASASAPAQAVSDRPAALTPSAQALAEHAPDAPQVAAHSAAELPMRDLSIQAAPAPAEKIMPAAAAPGGRDKPAAAAVEQPETAAAPLATTTLPPGSPPAVDEEDGGTRMPQVAAPAKVTPDIGMSGAAPPAWRLQLRYRSDSPQVVQLTVSPGGDAQVLRSQSLELLGRDAQGRTIWRVPLGLPRQDLPISAEHPYRTEIVLRGDLQPPTEVVRLAARCPQGRSPFLALDGRSPQVSPAALPPVDSASTPAKP